MARVVIKPLIAKLLIETELSQAEIAEQCGCERSYVSLIFRTLGLPPRPRKRRKLGAKYVPKPERVVSQAATKMEITQWQKDEFGNLWREVRGL